MLHGNVYIAQHPAAVILCADSLKSRIAKIPPLSDAARQIAQNRLARERLVEGQRPGHKRCLVITPGAFVTVARDDGIAMFMSRTTESFRPVLLRQRLGTSFFHSVQYCFCQSSRFVSMTFMSQFLISLIAKGSSSRTEMVQRHIFLTLIFLINYNIIIDLIVSQKIRYDCH